MNYVTEAVAKDNICTIFDVEIRLRNTKASCRSNGETRVSYLRFAPEAIERRGDA